MSPGAHPRNPVLIVDDEYYILLNLSTVLKAHGMGNTITCQDGRQVMDILAARAVDVVLLDLMMPYVSGQQLLPRIREEYPEVPVIVITGATDVPIAVECMKLGVFDYLVKSIEESKLVASVRRAVEMRELRRENRSLRDHLVDRDIRNPEALAEVVHGDERMRSVLLYCESIAASDETVLVTGETGVGKELVARALHNLSGRAGAFVAVNAAGLDDAMLSDTLFGHARGAFTGADVERRGLVGSAAGGTLFLDEIGDLSPRSQVALLRLLESREYYPIGSDLARRTDARIVVATNQDLRSAIAAGHFRRDLYFRLQTHHVHVPPLRERPGDLPLLFHHFLALACAQAGREVPEVPRGLIPSLRRYGFPGNVRELRSMVVDAVSQQRDGPLSAELFERRAGLGAGLAPQAEEEPGLEIRGIFPTIRQATDFLVEEALRRSQGHQAKAARLLGISPPALSKRLKRAEDDTPA